MFFTSDIIGRELGVCEWGGFGDGSGLKVGRSQFCYNCMVPQGLWRMFDPYLWGCFTFSVCLHGFSLSLLISSYFWNILSAWKVFEGETLTGFKKYQDEHLNHLGIVVYGPNGGRCGNAEGCLLVGRGWVVPNGLFPSSTKLWFDSGWAIINYPNVCGWKQNWERLINMWGAMFKEN